MHKWNLQQILDTNSEQIFFSKLYGASSPRYVIILVAPRQKLSSNYSSFNLCCRNQSTRILSRFGIVEIFRKKLLVVALSLDLLWSSKEARWWRPDSSLQHGAECDGHECKLWRLKRCSTGSRILGLGDERCAYGWKEHPSSHSWSRFCRCHS